MVSYYGLGSLKLNRHIVERLIMYFLVKTTGSFQNQHYSNEILTTLVKPLLLDFVFIINCETCFGGE